MASICSFNKFSHTSPYAYQVKFKELSLSETISTLP